MQSVLRHSPTIFTPIPRIITGCSGQPIRHCQLGKFLSQTISIASELWIDANIEAEGFAYNGFAGNAIIFFGIGRNLYGRKLVVVYHDDTSVS